MEEQIRSALAEKYDLSKNGYVLVLHHFKFRNSKQDRAGSEVDMAKIKDSLRCYRTEPAGGLEVHDNLTLRQVRRLMDSVSRKDFSSNSCLIVIIMSHGGKDDTITAYDGKKYFLNQDVMQKVAENRWLVNKPKMFIVNACRGPERVRTVVGVSSPDTVLFQSTFEGHVSYRNPISGSRFMQLFFRLLLENDDRNILELNTMMIENDENEQTNIQICTMLTTLSKRLIFRDLRREV